VSLGCLPNLTKWPRIRFDGQDGIVKLTVKPGTVVPILTLRKSQRMVCGRLCFSAESHDESPNLFEIAPLVQIWVNRQRSLL
jgi:hypothetical protein